MSATVHHEREVVIIVTPRPDGPGYEVRATLDEKTAIVPAPSRLEADEVADGLRSLVQQGLGEAFFTD